MRRNYPTRTQLKRILVRDPDSAWQGLVPEILRFWEIPDNRYAFSGMTTFGWVPPVRRIGSSREMAVGNGATIGCGALVDPGYKI